MLARSEKPLKIPGLSSVCLRVAVTLGALAIVLSTQAQERQSIPSRVAAPAGASVIGRLPATQRLDLAISLPLRNPEQLQSLLGQLYDPASPSYRHFLTVQQFTDEFGPTAGDYAKVMAFAQAYGFTIEQVFPNRLVLSVSAEAADVERAFHVTIEYYQLPAEKRRFFAPNVEPSVESGVPILSVDGLSSFSMPRPMLKHAPQGRLSSNSTGSGSGGQFLGSDIRAAYVGSSPLDGSGQVLGLIEIGPYRLSDVQSYFSSLSQPLNVPISNVLLSVDGTCGAGCDDGEEAIDIQQAISMAPDLSGLIVYEAYGSASDALTAYTQAASDNIAKQLSISFGWGGTPTSEPGYEQVFEELAAQGQSSFVASGDAGANAGGGGYPGNSPNITVAGGTDLTTVTAGGAWQSEAGWSGSGGGWNTESPIPNYQVPAINSSNGGDPNYRNIPDLSAEANTDNYYCANGSCQGGIGGTSLAAPRWAGFTALINQQSASNATSGGNNPTIGFLNPTIYTLGQGSNYDSVFHDIMSGSNPSDSNPVLTCTPGTLGCLPSGVQGFNAVTGFDLVTGWGSPNGPSLFDVVAPSSSNPNFSLSSSPSTLNLSTPGSGGTISISLAARNGFSGAASLSVVIPGAPSSAPAGLTAVLSSSSLSSAAPVTLTISTASSTPGGTYLIAVVGTSGGLTEATYVVVALPAFVGLSAAPAAGVLLNQDATATSTIGITGINGFNSPVSLSASGLPSGVTGAFSSVNSTTSTFTLSATTAAPLTKSAAPYAVTVQGTASGNSPQSAAVNLFVDPPLSGGSGTAVDLSAAFNVYGFYTDASEANITATNSLDGAGYAYSANLIASGLDFNGTQFTFGPANAPDAVYGNGATIALPTGYYSSLGMLATGIEGNQASQEITVTYTDGTTSEFTQSFSDWCSALNTGCAGSGSNPGESVALAMPYRDSASGPDDRVFYLYGYSFALNPDKEVQSLTLPNNRDVAVLAATLAGPVTSGYSLSASPSSLTVPLGENQTTTITVTPVGGFGGSVTLSASGLPSGVTASFSPASTTGTSTLTLTASSSATVGSAVVTITGSSGSSNQTTLINIQVTPPPSYSLSAGTASPASVSPGGSASASVTITPANTYTGTVTLSCAIAPTVSPAPSCSFVTDPVSVTGTAAVNTTLTFATVGSSSAAIRPPGTLLGEIASIAALVFAGLYFVAFDVWRKRRSEVMLSVVLVGIAAVLVGCGSGGGAASAGTPAGSYTVTITAKDASGETQSNSAAVTVSFNVD
jgi:hypothetical protein